MPIPINLIPEHRIQRYGPKRLMAAQGIKMDPVTKRWTPKKPKPVVDQRDVQKLRAKLDEVADLPAPVESLPFDFSKYRPLPGRVLLRITREPRVVDGILIPDQQIKEKQWLEVVAMGDGEFDFKVGDRVALGKRAHKRGMMIENVRYGVVKVRHVIAVLDT